MVLKRFWKLKLYTCVVSLNKERHCMLMLYLNLTNHIVSIRQWRKTSWGWATPCPAQTGTEFYLVKFKFRILYPPGLGGSSLSSVTPSYPLPPKITKQTIYQLPTGQIWSISSCLSPFPGVGVCVGVAIIKLKTNLSSRIGWFFCNRI